jgi:hypothetical protein
MLGHRVHVLFLRLLRRLCPGRRSPLAMGHVRVLQDSSWIWTFFAASSLSKNRVRALAVSLSPCVYLFFSFSRSAAWSAGTLLVHTQSSNMYEAVITCSNAFPANSSVKCLRSFSTKIAARAGARYALSEWKPTRGGGDAMAFGGALVCEGGSPATAIAAP